MEKSYLNDFTTNVLPNLRQECKDWYLNMREMLFELTFEEKLYKKGFRRIESETNYPIFEHSKYGVKVGITGSRLIFKTDSKEAHLDIESFEKLCRYDVSFQDDEALLLETHEKLSTSLEHSDEYWFFIKK